MIDIQKNVNGRPTVITDECVKKLEDMLRLGCTDKASCAYAEISRESFYNRIQKDDTFRDRMENARNYAIIASRQIIIQKILKEKDPEYAKWYLEKHDVKTSGVQQSTQVNIFQDLKEKYTKKEEPVIDINTSLLNEQHT